MLHPRRFAAQAPDHPAVIMGRTGEVITYRMLDEEANRLAHLLRDRGLGSGDHLAIVSETTTQSMAVIWAAQLAGLIYTPINYHLTGGEVQAVLFEPQDVELVFGPPSARRRYLDLTLSQVDPRLFRSLQEYNRVLAQRNSLLKAVRERRAGVDELSYWDEGLVAAGAVIVGARRTALGRLGALASETHGELTAGAERLDLTYVPSLAGALEAGEDEEVGALFKEALAEGREREVAQGTTLVGPHRDDFTFTAGGANLATFGSRGQQRLATLALKLAEAKFMEERAGEPPVLLLDDVLSELDPARRRYLTERVERHAQAIITTADLASFEADFLDGSRVLRVAGGAVDAC